MDCPTARSSDKLYQAMYDVNNLAFSLWLNTTDDPDSSELPNCMDPGKLRQLSDKLAILVDLLEGDELGEVAKVLRSYLV